MNGSGRETYDFNNTFYLNENHDDDYMPYSMRPETYIVPIVFGLIFLFFMFVCFCFACLEAEEHSTAEPWTPAENVYYENPPTGNVIQAVVVNVKIGTFGNGTLILVFLRHRNMRNEPNFYILSLAIGDLLVILFCVPFTSTIYTLESWPYGDIICKISEWTKDVSIGVSVFTLTALSAERYCAIVNPLRKHAASGRFGSKMLTFCTALFIWLVAIIMSLPSLIFSHVRVEILGFNRTIRVCTPFPDEEYFSEFGITYRHVITIFKFFTYYAFPLCVIAFFYTLMAIQLEASTRNIPGENHGQIPQVRTRKKVAKLVLVFVAIFVICFGPYHIFMLWFHLNADSWKDFNTFWNAFRIVGFCLSFSNSCINPIALYFISGTFRKYFNIYLFSCCVEERFVKRGTFCETSTHSMAHFGNVVRVQPGNGNVEAIEPADPEVYHADTI